MGKSLFGDDTAAKEAERERKAQEAKEAADMQQAEEKRTRSMRSRFTGGALAGSSTLG